MLQLCGIPLSNYYNKVKFVLLEHDIPFEESVCGLPVSDPAQLADSPLGKIPFLKTEEGALFESQVIIEYWRRAIPKRHFPGESVRGREGARTHRDARTLSRMDGARGLHRSVFGGKVSDGMKAHVERLPRAIDGFKQMTQFSPYVLGESFGLADIAAWVHLPVIGMATKAVFGRDFLLDAGIDWKAMRRWASALPRSAWRPSARRMSTRRASRARKRGSRRAVCDRPCRPYRRASRSSADASVLSCFAKQNRTTPDSCGS